MIGVYLSMLDTSDEKRVFEQLYKKYRSIMYNNAYRILNDEYLAEDAVHNAFMSLIKNFDKISGMDDDEARSYLLIINRNAAYALYNKSGDDSDIDDYDNFQASENIELDIEAAEGTEKIFEMIKSLDSNYSDVLALKFFYDMSDAEIAEALGITVDNVRVRIFRGKNKLKKLLGKEYGND